MNYKQIMSAINSCEAIYAYVVVTSDDAFNFKISKAQAREMVRGMSHGDINIMFRASYDERQGSVTEKCLYIG